MALGDRVLSRSEEGELSYEPVTRLFVRPDAEQVALTFTDVHGVGAPIITTPEHPFRAASGEWVPAGRLDIGDNIVTAEGSLATLSAALSLEKRGTVYNFEVAGTHTYFVGEAMLWVHNNCTGGRPPVKPGVESSGPGESGRRVPAATRAVADGENPGNLCLLRGRRKRHAVRSRGIRTHEEGRASGKHPESLRVVQQVQGQRGTITKEAAAELTGRGPRRGGRGDAIVDGYQVTEPQQLQHIKVGFSGADGVVERLWATRVEGDLYRLDNAPAFAFGVSLHDVVEVYRDETGAAWALRVARRGPVNTVRVVLEAQRPRSRRLMKMLAAIGCSSEGMNAVWFAVSAPDEASFVRLVEHLAAGGYRWEYVNPKREDVASPDATAAIERLVTPKSMARSRRSFTSTRPGRTAPTTSSRSPSR